MNGSDLALGEDKTLDIRLEPVPQTASGAPTGKTWKEPYTGMEFVWVPKGCFQMGSPSIEIGRDPDERSVHEVCLDGFWMGKYEVTNRQFRQFRSGHDSYNYEGLSLNGMISRWFM